VLEHPKCKYIKRETTGIACPRPGCKGELIVKRSKRGKSFYGCSEYPKCENGFSGTSRFRKNARSAARPSYFEKTTKKGVTRYCSKEDCGYRSELQPLPPPRVEKPRRRQECKLMFLT